MKKIYGFVNKIITSILLKSNNSFLRNYYWNKLAKMIDKNWGKSKKDHKVLELVLKNVNPKIILDIGCGSGRCFPLYESLKIETVYAQDVSSIALDLSKKNHPDFKCNYLLSDIINLKFEENYFDLILSSRVLAAVLPENIENVIKKITNISKLVYINEMSDSDFLGDSLYWFKHDYDYYFEKNNFQIENKGIITLDNDKTFNQTWKLYKKLM